jgi:hypothetical protein
VINEIRACTSISSLAHLVDGIVSVGEKRSRVGE